MIFKIQNQLFINNKFDYNYRRNKFSEKGGGSSARRSRETIDPAFLSTTI